MLLENSDYFLDLKNEEEHYNTLNILKEARKR